MDFLKSVVVLLSLLAVIAFAKESQNAAGVDFELLNDLLIRHHMPERVLATSSKSGEFEEDLEKIFTDVLNGTWDNAPVLMGFARLTPNITVKLICYDVLWHEIESGKLINNPFVTVDLCLSLQYDLGNLTLKINQGLAAPLEKDEIEHFEYLELSLHDVIATRSAQILEGAFHASKFNRICEFPLLQNLLNELQLLDDSVFDQTIDEVYYLIDNLETTAHIAAVLTNFINNTRQSVVANVKFAYTITDFSDRTANLTLTNNLLALRARATYTNEVSYDWRERVEELISSYDGPWSFVDFVCIQNATANNLYISECPNNISICQQTKNLIRDRFKLINYYNGSYAFSSVYWNGRYLGIDYNTTELPLPFVMKNVLGTYTPTAWKVIESRLGLVELLDIKSNYKICAGAGFYPNDRGGEYVYSRRTESAPGNQNECEWLIEAC